MKADYKIGICFSNDDPNYLGRIRVIPIEYLTKYSTLLQINNFILKEDANALKSNEYKPWFITKIENFKHPDKYLCEPFLPKSIAITPTAGQLVKIIVFDDIEQINEFIGPYTIDQITLTEQYRSVVDKLNKNITLKEVLPKKGKTFISGYNNEQIILGNNEILMRLNHINQSNKTRKTSYPFIQLSNFNHSYNLIEKSVTISNNIDINIDYLCELFIDYQPKENISDKNFIGTLILSDSSKFTNSRGELGLTKNTFNQNDIYVNKNTSDYIVKYYISSKTSTDFIKIIDEILLSYNSGGVVKYFDINNELLTQQFQTENTNIIIYNNISQTPNSGGGINPTNIIPSIKSWVFRLTPTTDLSNYLGTFIKPNLPDNNIETLKYNDYIALDNIISKYSHTIEYGKLLNNTTNSTIVKKLVPSISSESQSVNIAYSDKFLFLSSLNSLNIINDLDYDGIPATKIAEYINNTNQNVKTYGFVRGEKLMNLINELIDMFSKHGHEIGKDPRASIIKSTQESIDSLKKKINDELKEGQNNVIINHNFRLN